VGLDKQTPFFLGWMENKKKKVSFKRPNPNRSREEMDEISNFFSFLSKYFVEKDMAVVVPV
jgi:hypothetical protein